MRPGSCRRAMGSVFCRRAGLSLPMSASHDRPAERSLLQKLLPLGLAHGVTLKRDIAEGECLRWSDVSADEADHAVRTRREIEQAFARRGTEAAAAEAV